MFKKYIKKLMFFQSSRPSDFPHHINQVTVCQKCGVTGFSEHLVYCVQCQAAAEHRYCLNKLPKINDEDVIWKCEQCLLRVDKQGKSRKSECVSLKNDQAAEARISLKKKGKVKVGSSVAKAEVRKCKSGPSIEPSHDKHVMVDVVESVHLSGDCSLPVEDDKNIHFHGEDYKSHQRTRKRRRLILEDDGSTDEEAESVEGKTFQIVSDACDTLNNSCHEPFTDSHYYPYAQPIIDPVWRGCFRICNEKFDTDAGLVAHLSSKACSKVWDGVNALPPLLGVEMLPRLDIWPESFCRSPPNDDSIALYFFPETESEEITFDVLLEDIINLDLALKFVIDNTELLVFSSDQLPQDFWRFKGKYYLWGVFKGKQVPLRHNPIDKSWNVHSPLSPLSTNSTYGLEKETEDSNVTFSPSGTQTPEPFDSGNDDISLGPCLKLFPLEVEDMAIATKVPRGEKLELELELGLGR